MSTAMVAGVALFCLAAIGCRPPERVANQAFTVGLEVAASRAADGGRRGGQAVVGLRGSLHAAETDEMLTYRARGDVGLGGNGQGFAGRADMDVQLGIVAFPDDEEHFFVRLGVAGFLENDPVGGYYALEAPTLFFGHQHHGDSLDDTFHLDVGPRVSLGVAGRAFAPDGHVDFVAAPGVGGAVLFMGEAFSVEVTYTRFFDSDSLHVVRSSACLALFLAVCLDTRHVVGDIGPTWDSTAYYGVTLGMGLSSGQSPPWN